jgi:hypothetical protein
MGNSLGISLTNYKAQHLPENLLELAFGAHLAPNKELTKVLQDASLSRDVGAPLYVSQEDWDAFERRSDIRKLRADYKAAVLATSSSDPEAKRIAARIKWIRDWLCDLKVKELRAQYFETVDRLRSLGQSTRETRLAAVATNPRNQHFVSTSASAEAIGRFLSIDTDGAHRELADEQFGDIVVAFLASRPLPLPPSDPVASLVSPDVQKGKGSVCLLCCKPYCDRSKLTRHVKSAHKAQWEKPFGCPECIRQNKPSTTINGPAAWAAHVERSHGKSNTPVLRSLHDESAQKMACPLCSQPYLLGTALTLHMKKMHQARGHLENETPCAICGVLCQGTEAWTLHIDKHIDECKMNHMLSLCKREDPAGHYGGGSIQRPGEQAGRKRPCDEDPVTAKRQKALYGAEEPRYGVFSAQDEGGPKGLCLVWMTPRVD